MGYFIIVKIERLLLNNSGHYKPSKEMMAQLIDYLEENGIDLSETIIKLL